MSEDEYENQECPFPVLRPTDRLLPIANIAGIMKKPIPSSAKIAKESKKAMQLCASEFIAIVTCRAKDFCSSEARKTLTGDDIIRALSDLDMPFYSELANKHYEKYRNYSERDRKKLSEMNFMNFSNENPHFE